MAFDLGFPLVVGLEGVAASSIWPFVAAPEPVDFLLDRFRRDFFRVVEADDGSSVFCSVET